MKKIIITAIVFVLCLANISFAEDTNVKNYKFEKEICINGVLGSTSKFINIEKTWDVQDVTLNLNFSKSQIINGDMSSLTVIINDIPIRTIKLDAKKDYKENLVVKIPNNYLKEGYNEIKIKAFKTISDKICQDDNNTGNWLVLNKESFITMKYKNKDLSNLISEFPFPYLNTNADDSLDTTILLSDDLDRGELSAIFNIASNFGKITKDENLKFNVKFYSEAIDKTNNIIYIGKFKNTPNEILNLLTEDEKSLLNSNCIVKQVQSPYNNKKKMLVIIGNEDENIIKASKLLTNNNLSKQVLTSSVTINEKTNLEIIDEKDYNKTHIKLKDLGYSNILLEGPFTQEAIFDVKIPEGKIIEDEAKLVLNLRYAENLDFQRSLATIYVNNVPIGSQRLEKQFANNHKIELKIPKDAIGKNYYQIKVSLSLLIKDVGCVTRETKNPWGYILNSSYLNLPMKDNELNKLNSYPYPFVKNEKFNDLAIIVPDKVTSNDIERIVNIAKGIGRSIKLNDGNVSVVKGNEFEEKYKDCNLIIFGTPQTNNVIKDLNKNLNLKFNDDFSSFISNDKFKLIDNYGKSISAIQLIESPYNEEKKILSISSSNEEDLQVGMNYLIDLTKLKDTNGDTLTIDKYNNVNDLGYKTKVIEDNKEKTNEKAINKSTKNFIVFGVGSAIAILILSILFARKYKKK